MFVVNNPILQCEHVIIYDPHTLYESILSSLLPDNYLYLFTKIHAHIFKNACLWLTTQFWNVRKSSFAIHTHCESLFSSSLLLGNNLNLFTNFHACILKMQVCGKRPHFTLWECHCLKSTHIIRVYFFVFIA